MPLQPQPAATRPNQLYKPAKANLASTPPPAASSGYMQHVPAQSTSSGYAQIGVANIPDQGSYAELSREGSRPKLACNPMPEGIYAGLDGALKSSPLKYRPT